MAIETVKKLIVFSLVLGLVCISAISAEEARESDAKKWLKTAEDTLALVEQTAKELIDAGIEKITREEVKGEWSSAGEWLDLAKKKLSEARKLCEQKKWKECSDIANESWQYLVKAATAALNAGRSAGLK